MHRIAVVLLLCLTACGGLIPDPPQEAEMLAGKVLSAAGEGDSATIWDKWSAPKFRAAVSREKFEKAVVGLHQKLGAVRSKTRVGYHIKTGAGPRDVHLNYEVTWEKGKGTATIRLFEIAGEWKLVHLNANSPVLLE